MFLLGAVISLASIPGVTSITIPAGWAALSCLLPLTLWREAKLTSLHVLFLAFLAYAALASLWAPSGWDACWRLWQLTLIYLAFRLGSTLTNLWPIISGLAFGCLVSTFVAGFQWLGYTPVMAYSTASHAGLFYNPAIAGQTIALVAIVCLAFDRWVWAIALLPGIWLSDSRGALAVLILALVLNLVRRNLVLTLAILAGLALILGSHYTHDFERLLIWRGAIGYLTYWGNGPGSMLSLYITVPDRLIHPTEAHNDLLQILFEFGLPGAIALCALFGSALVRTSRPEWLPLACFTFLSFFAFPLFTPISACLMALCAGRLSSCGNWSWSGLPTRGSNLFPWHRIQPATVGAVRSEALPALARHP